MLKNKMFGRTKGGSYPHAITLSAKHEEEASILMEYENRNLSNLIEKAIHDKYSKLPQTAREKYSK